MTFRVLEAGRKRDRDRHQSVTLFDLDDAMKKVASHKKLFERKANIDSYVASLPCQPMNI